MKTTVAITALIGLAIISANLQASAQTFAQKHPRRAEVLHRDNKINNEINNQKGNLGGHYSQLKAEDRAIRHQEQADARANGGFITKGEQRQLNHEENHLQHQVKHDEVVK
jgi:hypothetical protein